MSERARANAGESAGECPVGALMRALLAETPSPPAAGATVQEVAGGAARVLAARQALIDRAAAAGRLPATVAADTHAACAAVAAELRALEEEWRAALAEARRQVAAQRRGVRQLQKFAAAR